MVGFGMQWHHLDNMKTVCTSLHADNHTINQFFFQAACSWASAHRGKWGQLTPLEKMDEKLKSEHMQKRAVF